MTGGRHAVVLGAGVVGLCCALRLVEDGWRVRLVSGTGEGASAAAAGMIAPASEAVLDEVHAAVAQTWRRAASMWPRLAERTGGEVRRPGALHLGPEPLLAARAASAERLGFKSRRVRRPRAGLLLPEDALVDPGATLAGLERAFAAAGGTRVTAVASVRKGALRLDGAEAPADLVIVAAGWGASALAGLAPELARLSPIKGQLLRLETASGTAPAPGPVLRARDVYLAPQAWGWAAGATMEPGRSDLVPDAARLAALRAAAEELRPDLVGAAGRPAVGVRATTPDGAPLVGPSRTPGVLVATGMRRNGWLLAPLVAEAVAAYASGRDAEAASGGAARAWSPGRFDASPQAWETA